MIKSLLNKNYIVWLVVIIGLMFIVSASFKYIEHYFEIKNSLKNLNFSQLNSSGLESYVAIWGGFGDFIGGTFNPVIGVLSVILLFVTWRTTVQTLNQTQLELAESRIIQSEMQKTQLLQQFDSFFFPFLQQLKLQENLLLIAQRKDAVIILDQLYERIFGNSEYPLAEPNEELKNNHLFNSYFLCLSEILKNIDNKFSDEKETAQVYANIIKSTMPMKLQQLMALFLSDSPTSLNLFIKYNFLENISLRVVDSHSLSPLMIAIVQSFNTDIFGNFRNLLEIFGNSNELNKLKNQSTLFQSLLTQQSEMMISGIGVLNRYVFNFSKINIAFDMDGAKKEFIIIDHSFPLLLTIEKRLGTSLKNSKFVENQEIYVNKINLDFDMFEISVFREKITISKNDSYLQAQFNREYLARKENSDEEIIIASSFDIIKNPS